MNTYVRMGFIVYLGRWRTPFLFLHELDRPSQHLKIVPDVVDVRFGEFAGLFVFDGFELLTWLARY